MIQFWKKFAESPYRNMLVTTRGTITLLVVVEYILRTFLIR